MVTYINGPTHMSDNSEMIDRSKVMQLGRQQGSKSPGLFSKHFANRTKNVVAQLCRSSVAAVSEPIDELLQFIADEDDRDPGEVVDVTSIGAAIDRARDKIMNRDERDLTQIEKYTQRLVEPDKSVVTMRAEGLTYQEIAAKTNLDPHVVLEILSLRMAEISGIYAAAPPLSRK